MPEDGPITHANDLISNSGDRFDDWSSWLIICSGLEPCRTFCFGL